MSSDEAAITPPTPPEKDQVTAAPAPASKLPPAPMLEVDAEERFRRQVVTGAALLLIAYLIIQLAVQFQVILEQLLTAILILYLIVPLHHYLVRRGIPSLLSYIVIVAGFVAMCTGLGFLIGSSISDLQAKIPLYRESFANMLEQSISWLPSDERVILTRALHGKSLDQDQTVERVRDALNTLSTVLSQAFVIIIYLAFLLAELTSLKTRVAGAFTEHLSQQVQEVIHRINVSIAQYVAIKTAMSLLVGAGTSLVLLLFGVDYPILWGLLAFLLNFIPYLGSLVAVVFPVLLALVQLQSFWLTFCVAACLLIVQNVVGYLIEPKVTGARLDLSPLVIILSLAFWGALWGVVGMVLAIPLMVVLKTILDNIPGTRPAARLLANR